MKKIVAGVILSIFMFGTGVCFADSGIPNLMGTWIVQSESAVLTKDGAPSAKNHHRGEFGTLTAELVVTKQQGRVLRGTFKSPRCTEDFVAVIGLDNKSFYLADEDGFTEGRIIGKNKINIVYRHVTPADTVVAVGTYTRKK